MKVGDLVRSNSTRPPSNGLRLSRESTGVVVELVQKKVWRTSTRGKRVNWDHIDPESHAVVLLADKFITIPVIDLEVCNENR